MPSDLLRVAQAVRLGTTDVSLLGAGSIWVDDCLVDDSSIRCAQSIMSQALEGTAPGQLEIIVYDDGLSGLASPFWPLNSGGERILHILNDEQDFHAMLRHLRDHVQAVKNVMQGLAPDLVRFRQRVDYPVEGYKLVVVSTDFATLDDQSQAQLAILLKAGTAAGVSFLIHSMTLGANPYIIAMCEHLTVKKDCIEREAGPAIQGWSPPSPEALIATSSRIASSLASTKMAPIAFTEVQATSEPWGETSEDGVTFAVGKYGLQTIEVTLGDELNQRHNMLVTGAVGQGKSNLISVIIHSLCQRYSPTQIELYLLDFKEGVTLQAFYDEAKGTYLPHARVLGLEADREFGLSVLRDLFAIYKARMKLFKASGVQSLRQYREENPSATMPRIIAIIDEFQMMFAEQDRVSDEIADLLVRGVRLFRACGIHIILASQTIGGNMALMGAAGEGLFGQVPVRVALKNSLAESRATLGDKNDAAAHLRAREAIVNQDYGEVSANKKTSIAFADESVLEGLRLTWWEAARGDCPGPYVFVGEKRRSLSADAAQLAHARTTARPAVMLGSRIEVGARPMQVPFGRDIGRNIAVLGSGDAVAEIMNMALSLAIIKPGTQFAVLDFLDDDPAWQANRDGFVSAIAKTGSEMHLLRKSEAVSYVADLVMSLAQYQADNDLILIGLGMDRCRTLPMEFSELIKNGPAVGVHVIGWWLKMDSFREQIGYGGEAFFDTRLALRLDAQSAKQLMADPLLEWHPIDNRVLVWDATELAEAVRIIPYTVFDPEVVGIVGESDATI